MLSVLPLRVLKTSGDECCNVTSRQAFRFRATITQVKTYELTDEWAEQQWAMMLPQIETMMHRIQDGADFVVQPGSQLAADDEASQPYFVSSCAKACLNAGVGHLHAMKTLVFDEPRIRHAEADYSLIRGALENFATAFWVLHPQQRTIRVERALRWMAQNFTDEDKAISSPLGPTDDMEMRAEVETRGLQELHNVVAAIAQQAGCANVANILKGYYGSQAVKYAEEHSHYDRVLLMWQVCSGFAHGRPWANLFINAMEKHPTEEEGIFDVRMTTDDKRLALATLPTYHLMAAVVGLFTGRSR
jgi:hypothetical protein